LRYELYSGSIKVKKKKAIQILSEWLVPKSFRQCPRFAGGVGFYPGKATAVRAVATECVQRLASSKRPVPCH
jgi:hypothetical protein